MGSYIILHPDMILPLLVGGPIFFPFGGLMLFWDCI